MTLDEIGGAALYLVSDLSTGVTGDVHFVDSGYNVIAMPHPMSLKDKNFSGERAGNRQGRRAIDVLRLFSKM